MRISSLHLTERLDNLASEDLRVLANLNAGDHNLPPESRLASGAPETPNLGKPPRQGGGGDHPDESQGFPAMMTFVRTDDLPKSKPGTAASRATSSQSHFGSPTPSDCTDSFDIFAIHKRNKERLKVLPGTPSTDAVDTVAMAAMEDQLDALLRIEAREGQMHPDVSLGGKSRWAKQRA